MSDTGFPTNVIEVLHGRFTETFPDHEIQDRPLRYTDPARSVGLYVSTWVPDEENSKQIGQVEPALSTYLVRVQNMIQAADEVDGRTMFTVDAKIVRAMLYRDPSLRVALGSLTEEMFGTIERLQRFGVRNQSFLNNELEGQFVFLATTDFWIETETTKLN